MKRNILRYAALAAAMTLSLGVGGCAVYEPAPAYPAYPAYGYYPAPAYSSSTFVFRGDFGDDRRPHRHRHWR